jgi:hypothetical protein
MSRSESPDDLGSFELFSREEKPSTDIGPSIPKQSKVLPMAATAKAKVALSGPDRLIFRLEK